MRTMQQALLDQLDSIIPELASDLISAKLAKQGIKLSTTDKRRIASSITRGSPIALQFRKWKFWEHRSVDLDFSPDEIKDLEDKSAAVVNKLAGIIEPISEELSDHLLQVLTKRWPDQNRQERRIRRSFESRLARTWKQPIQFLSMILTIAKELGENVNTDLRKLVDSNQKYSVEALTRLHARACQVTSEIVALLTSGFADGAIARWRTLHEIAVVALFLKDQGEEVAERYIAHDAVESYKAAINYEKYRERLGEQAMDQSELTSLAQSYNDALTHFGKEFREPYGWASSALRHPNPKFADIEHAVGIDHLRPYYKMASYNVHANAKGVFFKLGLIPETQMLLAGPSNVGFADPGQNAALSLTQISSALVALHPTLDSIVATKIMLVLSRQAAEAFVAVQLSIEQNSV